jgi:hypothetical protein
MVNKKNLAAESMQESEEACRERIKLLGAVAVNE